MYILLPKCIFNSRKVNLYNSKGRRVGLNAKAVVSPNFHEN